jgi:hypothetical protein
METCDLALGVWFSGLKFGSSPWTWRSRIGGVMTTDTGNGLAGIDATTSPWARYGWSGCLCVTTNGAKTDLETLRVGTACVNAGMDGSA